MDSNTLPNCWREKSLSKSNTKFKDAGKKENLKSLGVMTHESN